MPVDNIGNWSTSTLVKFIRDVFQNNPPQYLPNLHAEDMKVSGKLTISDLIEFTKDPNWHNVGSTGNAAWENSWVDYGLAGQPVGYWKDPLGWVHLRGMIKNGTLGVGAFTLPPGLRPPGQTVHFALSNNAVGRVDVHPEGTVMPMSPSSNLWISLFGIHFKV